MSDLHGTLICHSLQQYGLTALMRASMEGEVECMRILLERGAQADTQSKVSISMWTVRVMCEWNIVTVSA